MLSKNTAELFQEYTQIGGVRPFGVSLLIAGVDREGPKLYQVDPSGTFWAWKATAIGKNSDSAKDFLEKRYEGGMLLEDAIQTALLTMKENFEGEMNEKNIEVGVINQDDGVFRILTEDQIKDYLKEAS